MLVSNLVSILIQSIENNGDHEILILDDEMAAFEGLVEFGILTSKKNPNEKFFGIKMSKTEGCDEKQSSQGSEKKVRSDKPRRKSKPNKTRTAKPRRKASVSPCRRKKASSVGKRKASAVRSSKKKVERKPKA